MTSAEGLAVEYWRAQQELVDGADGAVIDGYVTREQGGSAVAALLGRAGAEEFQLMRVAACVVALRLLHQEVARAQPRGFDNARVVVVVDRGRWRASSARARARWSSWVSSCALWLKIQKRFESFENSSLARAVNHCIFR